MNVAAFHLDAEAAIKTRIESSSPFVLGRYEGLETEQSEIAAAQFVQRTEVAGLEDQIATIGIQIASAQSQVDRAGIDYYTESHVVDSKSGGQVTTRTKTNYLENLKAEHQKLCDRKRLLQSKKKRINWKSRADDQLVESHAPLLAYGEVIEWSPRGSEQLAKAYEEVFNQVYAAAAKLKAAVNAPVSVKEVLASVDLEIDELASRPPNFGGHRRGSSVPEGGGIRVGNPGKRIGFVELMVTRENSTIDPVRLVAWAFKDQLRKACHEHIKASYSDEGAIGSVEKATLVPKLEAELWQQRRICEAAYLACRAAGLRNLNRPRDTPVEILLDVLPFKEARKHRTANAPAAETTPQEQTFDFDDVDDSGHE